MLHGLIALSDDAQSHNPVKQLQIGQQGVVAQYRKAAFSEVTMFQFTMTQGIDK